MSGINERWAFEGVPFNGVVTSYKSKTLNLWMCYRGHILREKGECPTCRRLKEEKASLRRKICNL